MGILIAIGSGIAIGAQSTFTTILGQNNIGAIRIGFMIHLTGAIIGGGMVLAFASQAGAQASASLAEGTPILSNERVWLYAILAGGLGMLILPGVATAFPRVGIVVGQASIIAGQIGISILVDTLGLAGGEPIPLEPRRLLGLLVLGIAVYLLLPSQN
jgi:transporter family-2 protein